MSTPKDKRAAPRRGAVGQAPIKLMTAPAPLGWCGTVAAAWTAHAAGIGIMFAAVAGITGWHRAWRTAVTAPTAVAVCLAAAPVVLAEDVLQRAQAAAGGEMLAREPALPAGE
jgi:hypothetical protein